MQPCHTLHIAFRTERGFWSVKSSQTDVCRCLRDFPTWFLLCIGPITVQGRRKKKNQTLFCELFPLLFLSTAQRASQSTSASRSHHFLSGSAHNRFPLWAPALKGTEVVGGQVRFLYNNGNSIRKWRGGGHCCVSDLGLRFPESSRLAGRDIGR